jgi:hypothetical protein
MGDRQRREIGRMLGLLAVIGGLAVAMAGRLGPLASGRRRPTAYVHDQVGRDV